MLCGSRWVWFFQPDPLPTSLPDPLPTSLPAHPRTAPTQAPLLFFQVMPSLPARLSPPDPKQGVQGQEPKHPMVGFTEAKWGGLGCPRVILTQLLGRAWHCLGSSRGPSSEPTFCIHFPRGL